MANFVKQVWDHVWLWIDWHGRITTVVLFLISLGGTVLVNRALVIWSPVSGVYLWVISLLTFAIFLSTLALAGSKLHPKPVPSHETSPQTVATDHWPAINVELTPSEGQGDHMFLAVKNLGKKQKYHGQCRILERRNDPNPQRRITLDLTWWSRSEREIVLVNGESCNLLIAQAGEMRDGNGWVTEWIKIVGIGESVESMFSRGSTYLPEYDLEISILGEGEEQPYTKQFTVKSGMYSALEMIPITLQSTSRAEPSTLRIYLDQITMGLKMGSPEAAYLFLRCRIISSQKTTSVTHITATAIMSDGEKLPCEFLEDLSNWLIAPQRGSDMEIEPLSLWSKLRKEPLVAEVQKEGWIGLVAKKPEWVRDPLQLIQKIQFAMEDGAHNKHVISVQSPWPEETSRLVIAKHLRHRGL